MRGKILKLALLLVAPLQAPRGKAVRPRPARRLRRVNLTCYGCDAIDANSNATVVVNIPAGSSNWASDFVYTIPAAVTNLTINGATVITWTGTAGQSNWNYTVNASGSQDDLPNDADTSINSLLTFTTGASGTKLTINGITLKGTASQGTKYAGTLGLGGSSRNIRLTNMYFNGTTNNSAEWIQTNGAINRRHGSQRHL